jgi:hypothetical protein
MLEDVGDCSAAITHRDFTAYVDLGAKGIHAHRGGQAEGACRDMLGVLRACAQPRHRPACSRKQTYSGRLARTKRVHQIEKPRVRPFPTRISEQPDLQGIDALRGPVSILRFVPLS